MKWITRERVKVDRVACPWLIKKFVDKDAEFIFVPADKVMAEAKRLDATPYDVKDVELGHHGKECSFEAILKNYKLTSDPALVLLGRIVNGADTDNTLYRQAEGPGLVAIAEVRTPRCQKAIPKLANKFRHDRTTPAVKQTKPLMAWTLLPKHCDTLQKTLHQVPRQTISRKPRCLIGQGKHRKSSEGPCQSKSTV